FSSRRRHTRSTRDWSSDVCSSDLVKRHIDWAGVFTLIACVVPLLLALTWVTDNGWSAARVELLLAIAAVMSGAFLYAETKAIERSEERRVGKERRCGEGRNR